MFGLGFGELVLLAVIALLVFGPDQLPIVARNVARFLNELKRTTDEFKKELEVDKELSSTINEIKQLRAKNILEGLASEKTKKDLASIPEKSSSLPETSSASESPSIQESPSMSETSSSISKNSEASSSATTESEGTKDQEKDE